VRVAYLTVTFSIALMWAYIYFAVQRKRDLTKITITNYMT